MTKRNDPCPCGSGMKYKKCCGKLTTKGGKFRPGPAPKQIPIMTNPADVMGLLSREIWKDLHIPDGEEIIRREAMRKQEFRK